MYKEIIIRNRRLHNLLWTNKKKVHSKILHFANKIVESKYDHRIATKSLYSTKLLNVNPLKKTELKKKNKREKIEKNN